MNQYIRIPNTTMVHRWHTTTTLTKCVVVWCCGCCFEYPQQHILTKYVVVWCCFPQHHTTTHFVKMCCCGYSKQHPQHHTTTHFVKMCCCGYSKQHPQHHTTTHFVKMCCCGYSKQHPQHHTTTHFVNVVVVCHLWTIVKYRKVHIYIQSHINIFYFSCVIRFPSASNIKCNVIHYVIIIAYATAYKSHIMFLKCCYLYLQMSYSIIFNNILNNNQ